MTSYHVDVDSRFARDAKEWKQESEFMSVVTDMVLLDSYQRIIGLGPAAIPLIIEDLKRNGPEHWFWALTAIVGEDQAHGATDVPSAAQAWINWWADIQAINREVLRSSLISMAEASVDGH